MRISWLGHASFVVESNGYKIVLDPFKDVPGCKNTAVTVDGVLCSHEHFDHCYCGELTLRQGGENPFTVTAVDTFHDEQQGSLRGTNKIHQLAAEGMRVVHLGDLGHPLTEAQAACLRGCDVLLIPVGGFYTMDAAVAADTVAQLQPRVVIPMHYRGEGFGFDPIDTVDAFLAHFASEQVRYLEENWLEVTAQTPAQVAVPAFGA